MTPESFIDLVHRMRESQKAFFALPHSDSRRSAVLRQSKKLEQQVDAVLAQETQRGE